MDQTAFSELVESALAHLYDEPFLQTHPLAGMIGQERNADLRGHALQRALVEAIEALQPRGRAVENEHAWRIYRYLFLRYVQVMPPLTVARQLAISERQGRRANQEAIKTLASILWDRYLGPKLTTTQSSLVSPLPGASPSVGEIEGETPIETVLDQEVRHLEANRSRRATDLASVVESLRSILIPLAERQVCSLSLCLEASLPALDVDRVVVRQIILEMVLLAVAHGPGDLRIEAHSSGPNVEVIISLRSKQRLSRKGEAVPLNAASLSRFALIRKLAAGIGGSVTLRADTRRSFILDLAVPRERPPTILIVDDNPDVLTVLERYLEPAGFSVVSTSRGSEALELAIDLRPAAITLDVMMADQDGWETLQLLKNHPVTQDIPVLVCSVVREPDLAHFLGAREVLPKPVTQPALLAALERCGIRGLVRTHPGTPSDSG